MSKYLCLTMMTLFTYSPLAVQVFTFKDGYACENTIMFGILHIYRYFFAVISTICCKYSKPKRQIKA